VGTAGQIASCYEAHTPEGLIRSELQAIKRVLEKIEGAVSLIAYVVVVVTLLLVWLVFKGQ
jgi:uncharacterized membrane protein